MPAVLLPVVQFRSEMVVTCTCSCTGQGLLVQTPEGSPFRCRYSILIIINANELDESSTDLSGGTRGGGTLSSHSRSGC